MQGYMFKVECTIFAKQSLRRQKFHEPSSQCSFEFMSTRLTETPLFAWKPKFHEIQSLINLLPLKGSHVSFAFADTGIYVHPKPLRLSLALRRAKFESREVWIWINLVRRLTWNTHTLSPINHGTVNLIKKVKIFIKSLLINALMKVASQRDVVEWVC